MATFKQIVLLVLDGFGVATSSEGNAISAQATPTLDRLVNAYPAITLQASGPTVGLPWGERGNSEVGHLNLGAGRIVSQYLLRITGSVSSGEFFENSAFLGAMEYVKKQNSLLHFVGLVSNGGVHSSEEHLFALLAMAADQGVKDVAVHMFTDGRDTPPKAALESFDRLQRKFTEAGIGKIATITGRFFAMDRAQHWELVEQTYQAMVNGQGQSATNPRDAILGYYDQQIFDETFPPTVIKDAGGQPVAPVKDNDAVVFFNFRPDRMVQLAKAFVAPNFNKFPSGPTPRLKNLHCVAMTEYEKDLPVTLAFPPIKIVNGLSEFVSRQGWPQFHVAESEKYAHVTSFFNGGWEDPWPLEERDIVTSPQSYQQRYVDVPEMSARAITQKLVEKLNSGTPFMLANFANADMVGHTGNKEACKKAVAVIDECIGVISKAAEERGACFIITADHGNIEQVINPMTGMIDKEHSMNPVPLIVCGQGLQLQSPHITGYAGLASLVPEGVLSDVSPTVIELFGLAKPAEMTAVSLIPFLTKQLA